MSGLRKEVLGKLIKNKTSFPTLSHSSDLSPIEWSCFFTRFEDVKLTKGTFRVYISDPTEETEEISYLLLHGAGLTALSWCCFVSEIKKLSNSQCVAIDMRNHGVSYVSGDMTIDSLVQDVSEFFELYFTGNRKVVVVGHSLGGSVAVRIANQFEEKVSGLVVLDAVEGLVLKNIRETNSFISSRPTNFKSLKEAITWRRESMTCINELSNRVSMPSQLAEVEQNCEIIYEWRLNLYETKKYWKNWFQGMSTDFLRASAKKLLILRTIDNLDEILMVGQMQGKFQLVSIGNCGHIIHEDVPDKVAEIISKFVKWHKLV